MSGLATVTAVRGREVVDGSTGVDRAEAWQ